MDSMDYNLILNDYILDDNDNIISKNSTWFLLKKSFMEEKMNEYSLKEGEIFKIGREIFKVKKIKFSKKKRDKEQKKDLDNISNNTEFQENSIIKDLKSKIKINEKKESKYNICRICYLEEESSENPLIQPCECSGSMKYIHLDCLKRWLYTSIFIKIESNNDSCLYLKKPAECELCKTKYPDIIFHNGKFYEILDFQNDFDDYLIIETLKFDENQNKYVYVVSLDQPDNKINIGRNHDCTLLINDISISRYHCHLKIDKKAKKVTIHDNKSKFGTLIFMFNKNIKLCQDLKLHIQVGRTYLELLLKERTSDIFDCCGISEKENEDYYYLQNKHKGILHDKLIIKTDNGIIDKYSNEEEDEKKTIMDNNNFNENDIYLKESQDKNSLEQNELINKDENEENQSINLSEINNL